MRIKTVLFLSFAFAVFGLTDESIGVPPSKSKEPKNAGITLGDIFPVHVEQSDYSGDGKVTKSQSVEFWAIKMNKNLSSGELLIITQVSAFSQRYPLYHLLPLKDIEGNPSGVVSVKAQQPDAPAPRNIQIKFAQWPTMAYVTGTLSSVSVISGGRIEKTFRNIDDRNMTLFIDKP
jgi:hypothetical protein